MPPCEESMNIPEGVPCMCPICNGEYLENIIIKKIVWQMANGAVFKSAQFDKEIERQWEREK